MKENSNIKFLVEEVVGCKWSMSILDMLEKGIHRPGALVKGQKGLTTKVLNERLRRLQKYHIVVKKEFPEIPPRVEYHYTKFGRKFLKIVSAIRQLEVEFQEME